MQTVKITNPSVKNFKTIHALDYDSFFYKFMGLMFRKNISEDKAVYFTLGKENIHGAVIHMFFMRFDIAVIWLDRNFKVVDKTLAKKWRPYYAPSHPAKYILETHPTRVKDFSLGDKVKFKDHEAN